ncbi:MAG: KH domain-containing protein [Polyangiales bacterium]
MSDAETIDRLRDLITYIACSLVDDPDAVEVQTIDEEKQVVIELTVGEGDLGKVIGKEGRTARAMRTLLTATSARMQKRALLDILE